MITLIKEHKREHDPSDVLSIALNKQTALVKRNLHDYSKKRPSGSGSLMAAMSQLAWEKDINLGTTPTLIVSADTKHVNHVNNQLHVPPKTTNLVVSSASNGYLAPNSASNGYLAPNSASNGYLAPNSVSNDFLQSHIRSNRVSPDPHTHIYCSRVASATKKPLSRPQSASGGSKDSAFDDDKAPHEQMVMSGSSDSLASVSSQNNLIHNNGRTKNSKV